MSRILRRPMFRGGRVDARGTGIASGLGYAGGGSVNTPKRGLVDGPGGYAGKYPVGGKMHRFLESPLGGGIVYGIPGALADFVNTPINQIGRMFGFNPGLSARKDIREQKDYLFGEDREGRMTDEEVDVSNFFLPFSAKSWKDEVAEQKEQKEDDSALSQAEIIAKIKAEEEAKRQALIDSLTPKELTEDEKLSKIEKNKAMIQKAYGSGVADDASTMLLNFAGKALKPEATVKSAFGEFFEEEGKRPSERKKYKDAATTAAINAFLTGEKTLAEVEAWKEKSDWSDRNKLAIARESKNWDTYLIEGAGTGGDPRKMGAISYAVSQMGEELAGVLPELEKGQTYGEILEEGPIYVQDSPDGSFKILVKWDGEKLVPIKQVYKR